MAQDENAAPVINLERVISEPGTADPKIITAQDENTATGAMVTNLDRVNGQLGPADPKTIRIDDIQFIQDLRGLKELRSFLIQEAIPLSTEESQSLLFGSLNLLRYSSERGRAPTKEEWAEVERHTQLLFGLLTDPLRRRFLLGQIPAWMSSLPILLAFAAVGALLCATRAEGPNAISSLAGLGLLPFYVIWLMCLGAIGSAAFLGMNALSVQQDITFDLSNRRLMVLRISLGALFGLVLTLPFGFEGFRVFITSIQRAPSSSPSSQQTVSITSQAILLLLPFILGFSTSLVIMILNRLVDGVQAFFGRTGSGSAQSESATRLTPPPHKPSRT